MNWNMPEFQFLGPKRKGPSQENDMWRILVWGGVLDRKENAQICSRSWHRWKEYAWIWTQKTHEKWKHNIAHQGHLYDTGVSLMPDTSCFPRMSQWEFLMEQKTWSSNSTGWHQNKPSVGGIQLKWAKLKWMGSAFRNMVAKDWLWRWIHRIQDGWHNGAKLKIYKKLKERTETHILPPVLWQ